jgi:uncharacterized membrane protein
VTAPFPPPGDHERERASNGYLMSLIAIMAGLPLPVVNLLATGAFYFAQRKGSLFVRWHCTQALLAQIALFAINASGVAWTLSIIFGDGSLTNNYIGYAITAAVFNLAEFAASIYAASRTRKGFHVSWWLFGPMTDLLVRR